MADPLRPELCIIGAGALGIALAKYAQSLGANVVLASRETAESGDNPHLNLHLAALGASAGLVSALRNGQGMGLTSVDAKVSVKAVQERAAGIVEGAKAQDASYHLAANDIEFVAGPVQFVDQRTILVGKKQIRPRAAILALGAQWAVPLIPGLSEIEYLTPEALLENSRKLSHLLIIGGSSEAFTIAQIYARLGSTVTIVPQGDPLPGFDRETVNLLLADLRREGVRVFEGAYVQSIHPRAQGTGATVAHPNGDIEALDLSHVAIAGTRQTMTAGLELEKSRVRALPGVDTLFASGSLGETTNPRVRVVGYAAGMVHWQMALDHGRAVVDSLIQGQTTRRWQGSARMVGTDPVLIEMGKVPDAAGIAKAGYKIYRSNLAENELAQAAGRARGLVKIITSGNGSIVGVSAVGPGASEICSVLSLAIASGMPIQRLGELPSPPLSYLSNLIRLVANQTTPKSVSWIAVQLRTLRKHLAW
jgi:pyruvate/2-oxoglutarate dehydrogenase complex dihydrolipoamide dehydrogenase (E3) component